MGIGTSIGSSFICTSPTLAHHLSFAPASVGFRSLRAAPGARDLGRAKTWAQALAATIAGLAAAGLWSDDVAWWALLIALVATWVSGLDYARVAPRVLRGEGA